MAAAALTYGPAIVGAIGSLFGGGKSKDLRGYAASLRPDGYVTDADRAAAAGTRRRLAGSATETGANLRMEALRRARQRGLDLSPATETTLQRVDQNTAAGREAAAQSAEEQLYNSYLGNKGFEQNKALALLGGKIQENARDQYRGDLRQSTFLNSILQSIPDIQQYLDSLGNDPTLGADAYGPADYLQGDQVHA